MNARRHAVCLDRRRWRSVITEAVATRDTGYVLAMLCVAMTIAHTCSCTFRTRVLMMMPADQAIALNLLASFVGGVNHAFGAVYLSVSYYTKEQAWTRQTGIRLFPNNEFRLLL